MRGKHPIDPIVLFFLLLFGFSSIYYLRTTHHHKHALLMAHSNWLYTRRDEDHIIKLIEMISAIRFGFAHSAKRAGRRDVSGITKLVADINQWAPEEWHNILEAEKTVHSAM